MCGFLNVDISSFVARACFCLALSAISVSALGSDLSDFGCGAKPFGSNADVGHEELGDLIAADFKHENFKALIEAATRWKEKNCLLGNGEHAISYWLSGFTKYFSAANDWQNSYAKINRFKAAYPVNVLPRLAEARYWSDFANSARGFGYASTVTSDGWRLFGERLEESERILLEIRDAGADWPQWYWQMIRVQSLLERDFNRVSQVFLDGVKKFPDVLAIYTEMAYYLEPRWGGSWEAVDTIVMIAARSVQREEADATYTRMYLATGELMPYGGNLFSDTKASWTRMRNGFIRLLEHYPESTLFQNEFLSYACIAKDRSTYQAYRKRIKESMGSDSIDHAGQTCSAW